MTDQMPVLFIGHGNPMNAIASNPFTETLQGLAEKISRPKAILCVSAHWMSEGTWITAMQNPKTIHDFYGFPKELFEVNYPAPGNPKFAEYVQSQVSNPQIHLDHELWGLDHGTWSVLKHMYPAADIPVMQLSIYMERPAEYHFAVGEQLRKLREQGVLIIGSGNIVHNLRLMKWEEGAAPYDWAIEFDEWVKAQIEKRDFNSIVRDALSTQAGKLSIPSPDHWFPLLYALGAADSSDAINFEFEGIDNASISMRAVSFGLSRL